MSDGTTAQSNPAETLQALHMMNFARRMELDQRNHNHAQAMGEAQLKRQWGDAFEPSEREDMDFRYNSPTTVHYHATDNQDSGLMAPAPAPMPAQPPPITPPPAPPSPPPEPEKPGILEAVPGIIKTAALLSTAGAAGAGLMLATQILRPEPPPIAEPAAKPPAVIIPATPDDRDTHYQLRLPGGKKPDAN